MRLPAIALVGALAVAACNDRVTAPASLLQSSPDDGQGVILGQVVGRTFFPPGDTGVTFTDEPVADARVDAFRIDSTPPDSGAPGDTLPPPPILVASTLTNAQGRFQLTALEAGVYVLAATPPAGSRFSPGSTSLFVDGRGTNRALIVLVESQDTVPPDTLPPPPDTLPPPPDTLSPVASVSVSGRVGLAKLFSR